ncbi:unnamed protein product [Periconia digitata]|uniref:Topoisomerase 1-associated factor 1 n=1 Tax=Periconia digitata TaxID=1303443 RepID=A0A9W4UQN7_9PLEO|nr:unnamed protein product [Periconia digitata]
MAQTTLDEWAKDPVDPEIRAHVYSLISALGGLGDDGTYSLGDDAFLCLKDLRRWLKLADGQMNRRDVARCMAEANLVKGDLLEILAKVSDKLAHDVRKQKIAVATLELLVPLTWPYEIDPVEATVNHHRHGPYVQLAQIGYKRSILHYDRVKILQTVVRVAIPSMTVPIRDRSPRDEGIIRIALYFIRNIVMLSPPKSVPMDIDEAEVARSAVIDCFQEQDIFQVLLSLASSIGDDFVSQDVVILEILFFLLKGIDAEKLFMQEKKLNSKNTEELKELIQKEKAMLAGHARHAPTRHNRFGTMIWLKQDEDKVSTISGQDVLGKAQKSMQKMDATKKWNKPKYTGRKRGVEGDLEEFDLPVALTSSARQSIKAFVEDFLDSSFNPLFQHLRKALEREVERVETRHSRQYFYLVSWFLRAECARRRTMKEKAADSKGGEVLAAEDESYGLVAEVMNQETFILLNRFMQKSEDEKAWQDLNAGMKCFTQILLTVHEMSESALDEDQEIAENIQNRIFYEETTHDRIVHTLRSYKDQGFGYLDAVTELAHVFLRMLERYSKQNVDMQVRSKKRARKIRKKQAQADGQDNGEEGHVSETEDITAAQKVVSERKFDFARFAAKFINQSSVNTFVAFTRYYKELSTEQLKRAHRFFYRVTFKMDIAVLLYRVDIIHLFNKMIKGPEGLDPESPSFKEWEEFTRHFFRVVVKKLQERPELFVEMLFSKVPATIFFLEHGYDKELPSRTPRAPAELEVKPGMDKPEQIGVAVGVLVNQQKSDALHWVRDVLASATEERKAWEDLEEARKTAAALEITDGEDPPAAPEDDDHKPPSIFIKPDNEERRIALFKDNKLRLLMTLVGFVRLGAHDDPEASWVVPSSLTSAELQEAIELIRKFEFDPPAYEDGKNPEDMLRSKAAGRRSTRRANFDDDSDGIDDDGEEDRGEYGVDGPTVRIVDGTAKKKLKRRRRARTPVELDEEEREQRAQARREKELEKQQKVKSTMFVHDSDEEDDDERDAEFFAREEALRAQTNAVIKRTLADPEFGGPSSKKRKAEKTSDSQPKKRKTPPRRKTGPFDTDESEEEEEEEEETKDISDDDSEHIAADTPLSSQHASTDHTTDKPLTVTVAKDADAVMVDVDGEEDEDDASIVRRPLARNARAGFVIDSDSDYLTLKTSPCPSPPQSPYPPAERTTYRRTFEHIRSRWEAAQCLSATPSKMPGRKEKSIPHQDLTNDENVGPRRFRRKLSDGLSFIANPLSQRKPVQLSTSSSTLATDAPAMEARDPLQAANNRGLSKDSGGSSTILQKSSALHQLSQPSQPYNNESVWARSDRGKTPSQLPHSRTMSYIPRPSRRESASSMAGSDTGTIRKVSADSPDKDTRNPPSKIPTPSPTYGHRWPTRSYSPAVDAVLSAAEHGRAGSPSNAHTTQSQPSGSTRSSNTSSLTAIQPLRATAKESVMPTSLSSSDTPWPKTISFQDDPSRPNYRSQRYSMGLSKIPETSPNRLGTNESVIDKASPGVNVDQNVSGHDIPARSPIACQRQSQTSDQSPGTLKRDFSRTNLHSAATASNVISQSRGSAAPRARFTDPVHPPTPPAAKSTGAQLGLYQSKKGKGTGLGSSTASASRANDLALQTRIGLDREIKHYMPTSYWAGRFQARSDEWRTKALLRDPEQCEDMPESLESCGLNQEDKAACFIFLQLRDLCVSDQAADSLWEFENSYRRKHQLLGKEYDFAALNPRKQSNTDTPQDGPIVRAVRRLTPRKSSFVSLMRGKGRSREESMSSNTSREQPTDAETRRSSGHVG